jgi:integrase
MAKKLLDQLREVLRLKHYSYRTEQAYVDWVRRFILFHNKRHPAEMGAPEIQRLPGPPGRGRERLRLHPEPGPECHSFLYREVLHKEIEPVLLHSPNGPQRLPTVLTRQEVLTLLEHLDGTFKLMAQLLYGSGLRRMECVRLRIQDVDFEYQTITVRDGKAKRIASSRFPKRSSRLCAFKSSVSACSMRKTWPPATGKSICPMRWIKVPQRLP